MPTCVIKHCNNSNHHYSAAEKPTYHKLPKDPGTRKKWEAIIRESRKEDDWIVPNNCQICADHFAAESRFVTKGGVNHIRKYAVPTENLVAPIVETEVEVAVTVTNENENHSLSSTESNAELAPNVDNVLSVPCAEIDPPSILSQWELECPIADWEIEPPIPHWEIKTPAVHCEIELIDSPYRTIPPISPNYLLVCPPSQDPEIQFINICIKREIKKFTEYRIIWTHKLRILQQKVRRLTRRNSFLRFKLWRAGVIQSCQEEKCCSDCND